MRRTSLLLLLLLAGALLLGVMAIEVRPSAGQVAVRVESLPPLPVPLAGGMLLAPSDTELLFVGGNGWENERKFFSDKSYLLDATGGRWRAGPDLPNPLAHAVAVKLHGQWHLVGGEDGQQVRDDLRTFKQVMETGEIVQSDATLRRGQPAQPADEPAGLAARGGEVSSQEVSP